MDQSGDNNLQLDSKKAAGNADNVKMFSVLKQQQVGSRQSKKQGLVHPINNSEQNDNKPADEQQRDEFQDSQEEAEIPERAANNRCYKFFYQICMHDLFMFSMTFAILLNTLVLALDRHPISYEQQNYLEYINLVLSYIFIAEMVIKLLGQGVRDYCNDSFNIFDGSVVIISIFELIISAFIEGGFGGGAISSLRAVRLLRVFKLARSWTSFRELLAKIIETLKDIQSFSCLLILFMFIFTLLGMELFAYRVKYNDDKPIEGEDVVH